ncbi:MAG: response regulator [Myxococcota bacterium]
MPAADVPDTLQPLDTAVHFIAETAVDTPITSAPVLVVEDNQTNQFVVSMFMSHLGYAFDIASNGQEAVTRFREQAGRYTLILMDCQMPVMDGYEATAAIRALPNGSTIPIIALTANVMNGDRQRARDAGMDDYLSKPLSRETLSAMLERWLADPTPQTKPLKGHP